MNPSPEIQTAWIAWWSKADASTVVARDIFIAGYEAAIRDPLKVQNDVLRKMNGALGDELDAVRERLHELEREAKREKAAALEWVGEYEAGRAGASNRRVA